MAGGSACPILASLSGKHQHPLLPTVHASGSTHSPETGLQAREMMPHPPFMLQHSKGRLRELQRQEQGGQAVIGTG